MKQGIALAHHYGDGVGGQAEVLAVPGLDLGQDLPLVLGPQAHHADLAQSPADHVQGLVPVSLPDVQAEGVLRLMGRVERRRGLYHIAVAPVGDGQLRFPPGRSRTVQVLEVVKLHQHRLGILQKPLAVCRQRRAPAAAGQQGIAQLLLQAPQGRRQVGLGNIQVRRRLVDGPGAGHLQKLPKLLDLHGKALLSVA